MQQKTLNAIAAAGGTGGHLFPAIAVINELARMLGDSFSAEFIGTSTRIESRLVPLHGYKLNPIPIIGFSGIFSLNTLKLPFKIWQSVRISRKLIRKQKAGFVLCTGAYISYPAGVAAAKEKVPLVLMESNVSPGKTISMLAPRADLILTSFEETAQYFGAPDRGKIHVTGNPIRANLLDLPSREYALAEYGFSGERKTLFVFGGSLGARSINKAMEEIVPQLAGRNLQLIWQTGKNYSYSGEVPDNVRISEFIDDMNLAYAASDLVVARSGATTLAELCAVGKPSLLVPLATASNNEQEINGRYLERQGGAKVILDKDLNAATLNAAIDRLMSNDTERTQMGRSALALGKPDATRNAAQKILELVGW